MFIASALIYPLVLAVLCVGTGLLADAAAGRSLHPALLPVVGAAGLIALTQLSTYITFLAPATPVLMLLIALGGLVLSRERLSSLARRAGASPAPLIAMGGAYLLALAPVLAAGRPTFSSFMALSDSAVHMIGADYLIRHGQDYSHLDPRSSYGLFINAYYNSGYPSGADTLLGGSAFLLGVPVIWAFQPLNSFLLALAVGPTWVIARGIGLGAGAAAAAALTSVLPALVFGYELIGSVKEITALSMILALGALVCEHRRWLAGPPRRAIPACLLVAAGVSSLGVAFGAWALVAAVVLAAILARSVAAGSVGAARAARVIGAAMLTLLIAAWPTWSHVGGSITVATNIASTGNAGNLHAPLRSMQLLGVWLADSYKVTPVGGASTVTHALELLTLLCATLGGAYLIRIRAYALASWIALSLIAWIAVTHAVTTWGSAKTVMLTSPVVLLLAWGGVRAIATLPERSATRLLAALVGLAIAGGIVASDAKQYHASNLAPTARYREMESVGRQFSGRGPALFTDFDEYAMYVLRDVGIAGPDFVYPPAAVSAASGGYGATVRIGAIPPAALLAYPLIITRRDPTEPRPPAAYSLAWQGSYYRVWKRRPGAAPALAHVSLSGTSAARCARIAQLAATRSLGTLVASPSRTIVRVDITRSSHPHPWGHQRQGLVMSRPGTLTASFQVPRAGVWDVWLQGQFMPRVPVTLDGRPLAAPAGELSGNSLVPNTLPPVSVPLAAGKHVITLTRGSATPAPGDGGWAVLDGILLTPGGYRSDRLVVAPASSPQMLCPSDPEWVEMLAYRPSISG